MNFCAIVSSWRRVVLIKNQNTRRSNWTALNAPTALLLATVSLSACGKSIGATDTACLVFSPIQYSVADTEETIRQIEDYLVRYERMCPSQD